MYNYRSTDELKLNTIQHKKDSQEWISLVNLSILSLYLTELTQGHEEQEDRIKIMSNSTQRTVDPVDIKSAIHVLWPEYLRSAPSSIFGIQRGS